MELRCASLHKRTIKSISLLIGVLGLVFVCYQLMMAQLIDETDANKLSEYHIVHNRQIVHLKRNRIVADSDIFECGDGLRITRNKINDDYCDCVDGSDEPDTSACAGLWYFECHIHHRKSRIPSSWVNDGICDCCDGSDESSGNNALIDLSLEIQYKIKQFLSPCPNTCPK